MKKLIINALIVLSFISCHSQRISENSKRPNIVFILADDFGIVDIQSYAKHFIDADTTEMYYETPNLNRLINEGVAFSQAYANPLCSPTRASIISGKYAAKLGFMTAMPLRPTYYNQNLPVPEGYYPHDVLEHKDDIKIEQAWINATSNSALPAGTEIDNGRDVLSIAEALSDYKSAFIGKWHIGGFGAEGYQPQNQGFDALAYYDSGASAYFNWKKAWNNKSKEAFPKMPQKEWEIGDSGSKTGEEYLTNDLTQQALNFLEKRAKVKDQPFFLYFSHFAVHLPYQGIGEDVEHFKNKPTKDWNGHKDPVYAAMIKSMDRSVGKILNKLKETGLEDNTLVIFMSDNGGIDSKITPHGEGTDNSPFLGGKATVNEGGIRVPLIFRWKNKVQGGKWVDVPVDMTDIYPSMLAAAGYDVKKITKEEDLDGQNLLPLLSDIDNSENKYQKDSHYWHYPFNVIYKNPLDGFALTPHSAVRKGDYKLIFDWYGRLHLYNIKKDPYEKNDLSSQNPKLTKHLFDQLMRWLKENVAPRYYPKLNPDYNPEKEVRKTPFKDLTGDYLKTNY